MIILITLSLLTFFILEVYFFYENIDYVLDFIRKEKLEMFKAINKMFKKQAPALEVENINIAKRDYAISRLKQEISQIEYLADRNSTKNQSKMIIQHCKNAEDIIKLFLED